MIEVTISFDLITYEAQLLSYCGPYSCKWLKNREPEDMARNRIQFQKGYSLTQFMDEYGSEERCVEALFRWRWPNGVVCPRCSKTGHCHVQNRGLYQCSGCRYQVSATAGMILASTKLPLRTWFLAMYMLTQTKNGISALDLSRQLSVSYNTAWQVKHKLMQAMKERDDTRPLGGWVQLDDAYWGGQRRGGKPGEARRARRRSSPIRSFFVRERTRAAIHRIRMRTHALWLPENPRRRVPTPCAYPLLRQDYRRLRSSRNRNATAPLTGQYDSLTTICRLRPTRSIAFLRIMY